MAIEWEEAILQGMEARLMADAGRWKLGDLALEIEIAYGEKRLQEFADKVGVSHSSMKVYRWVAGAYENPTRIGNLSWSHHRAVADHPDRLQMLAEAGREGWSVDFVGLVADRQQTRENNDESLDKLLRLLRQAYKGEAWKALGYT